VKVVFLKFRESYKKWTKFSIKHSLISLCSQGRLTFFACFCLLIVSLILTDVNFFNRYLPIKLGIIISLAIIISHLFGYLLIDIQSDAVSRLFFQPYPLLLIISYLPVLISGYFFHDDYILFTGKFINFFQYSLIQSRPVTGLLTDLLSFITVSNSYLARLIAFIGVLCFYYLFVKFLSKFVSSPPLIFVLSFGCATCFPFVNIVSYTVMFPYIWGAVFSGFSVVLFLDALDHWHERLHRIFLIKLLLSSLSLITSFYIYQPMVTVSIAFLMSYFLFQTNVDYKTRILKTCFYFIFLFIALFISILLMRLTWEIYGITPSSRALTLNTTSQVLQKTGWFIQVVIPNAIRELTYPLLGKTLYNTYPYGILTVNFPIVEPILTTTIMVIISGGLFISTLQIPKSTGLLIKGLRVILFILSFPISYFFFLLITESSYLSFYVPGLVMLFWVTIIYSISEIYVFFHQSGVVLKNYISQKIDLNIMKSIRVNIQFFQHQSKRNFVVFLLMLYFSIQSSTYLINEWVINYRVPYQLIKQKVSLNLLSTQRFHVIGSMIKGGEADIYAIFAVKMALFELGVSPLGYRITHSDTDEKITTISSQTMSEILKISNNDEIEFLKRIYKKFDAFSLWVLSEPDMSRQDYLSLRAILERADILPTQEDRAVIIDLR